MCECLCLSAIAIVLRGGWVCVCVCVCCSTVATATACMIMCSYNCKCVCGLCYCSIYFEIQNLYCSMSKNSFFWNEHRQNKNWLTITFKHSNKKIPFSKWISPKTERKKRLTILLFQCGAFLSVGVQQHLFFLHNFVT